MDLGNLSRRSAARGRDIRLLAEAGRDRASSVEFRDCSVIERETLEDGNFEELLRIFCEYAAERFNYAMG